MSVASINFDKSPYDAGTQTKLRIFELYAQAWLPVFFSRPNPKYPEVHLFDFFCGSGKDSAGVLGSPLRLLDQVRRYHRKGMAGWAKVKVTIHLFDESKKKVAHLQQIIDSDNWKIPDVTLDIRALRFGDALKECQSILSDQNAAKLLIIDQYGVDEVSDAVFKQLLRYPTCDFIFFLSSATLHRFRDHPAIKQKIEVLVDSYDVHRAAFAYYRKLIPSNDAFYLGPFSIKKGSNIYGLIFGSRHPLGIHKFLEVAWQNDQIAGEANFDIERENIAQNEMLLEIDEMRPRKLQAFERELENLLAGGQMRDEADIIRFCISSGMTCGHSKGTIKKLKQAGTIACEFRVPNVSNFRVPRKMSVPQIA